MAEETIQFEKYGLRDTSIQEGLEGYVQDAGYDTLNDAEAWRLTKGRPERYVVVRRVTTIGPWEPVE